MAWATEGTMLDKVALGIFLAAMIALVVCVSTPQQKCIGWPEQKYISDAGKKAPELGAFRQTELNND
jgi:hypothetical protein